MMQLETRPILFFDGGCSLCRKEIAFYRRLDKNNRIFWYDISLSQDLLKQYDIHFEAAMLELHAIDHKRGIKTGVDAFILVWKELPYFRHFAKAIDYLHLLPALRFCYKKFAGWRYKKQQCSL